MTFSAAKSHISNLAQSQNQDMKDLAEVLSAIVRALEQDSREIKQTLSQIQARLR